MRLLKTIIPGLIALLMLGMAAAPISAQMDEAAGSEFDDLDGLQRAVSRSYAPDLMGMFGMATPGAEPTGWFTLTALSMEFDSEDNAKAAVDKLMAMVTEGEDMGVEPIPFEDASLDVDFDHEAIQATQEDEGMTIKVLFALTQDGNHLYAVVGMTMGDDPAPVTAEMLTRMHDADAEDGEGTFSEDGTSEGGLWDTLPTLEQVQEFAPDLIEASDEIAFPMPEGTPAA